MNKIQLMANINQVSGSLEITDAELNSLTGAIFRRFGIDFTSYEPKSLKRRIVRALSIFDLKSIHELWVKILKDDSAIQTLIDELSVGLTSMFRDPHFWIRLKELIPEIIAEKGQLNICHAGCSTGEEVFTFNILLNESGLQDRVNSYAVDMNHEALRKAKAGKYHMSKFAEYDKNYSEFNSGSLLSKYYRQLDYNGHLDTDLIQNVQFEPLNLITDNFSKKFDLIFCRNVLIYFDLTAKKKVLDKFYEALNPDGYLVVGYFDSILPAIDRNKFSLFDIDHKIFQKISV